MRVTRGGARLLGLAPDQHGFEPQSTVASMATCLSVRFTSMGIKPQYFPHQYDVAITATPTSRLWKYDFLLNSDYYGWKCITQLHYAIMHCISQQSERDLRERELRERELRERMPKQGLPNVKLFDPLDPHAALALHGVHPAAAAAALPQSILNPQILDQLRQNYSGNFFRYLR